MGRSKMQGKFSLNISTVLNTHFLFLSSHGLVLICGIWLRLISNEVLKLLWMVSCRLNCQIQNRFGVLLFQIAMSITVFIPFKIIKVYFTNAVASVYIFESSFQSQLELFLMIKHIILTANSIFQKEKSYSWNIFW